jgi:hypothetical protein
MSDHRLRALTLALICALTTPSSAEVTMLMCSLDDYNNGRTDTLTSKFDIEFTNQTVRQSGDDKHFMRAEITDYFITWTNDYGRSSTIHRTTEAITWANGKTSACKRVDKKVL